MRRRNLAGCCTPSAPRGSLSRAAVASRIGLTRAAVSTLVDELIRWGLLEELGPERPGRVGRPGSALSVSGRGPAGIGAEIGGRPSAVCAVDLRGEVRARAVRHGATRGRAAEPVTEELTALIRQVVAEAERAQLWPAGLAVAVPGLVARDGRTVVRAPNLDWHGTDLAPPAPRRLAADRGQRGQLPVLWPSCGSVPAPPGTSCTCRPRSASVRPWSWTAGCCAGPGGSRGSWAMCPYGRTDLPARAAAGGAWSEYAGEDAGAARGRASAARDLVGLLAERAEAGDEGVRAALRDAGTALGIALTGSGEPARTPRRWSLGGALAGLSPGCCRRWSRN